MVMISGPPARPAAGFVKYSRKAGHLLVEYRVLRAVQGQHTRISATRSSMTMKPPCLARTTMPVKLVARQVGLLGTSGERYRKGMARTSSCPKAANMRRRSSSFKGHRAMALERLECMRPPRCGLEKLGERILVRACPHDQRLCWSQIQLAVVHTSSGFASQGEGLWPERNPARP